MRKTVVDMGDPRVVRLVLAVALPAVAGLAASAGHHAVNAVFIGALGPDSLAGVSMVMPLFLLVAATAQGLGVGLATRLARYLGNGDVAAASSVAVTALAAALPLGCGLSFIIYSGLPTFMSAMDADSDLLGPGLAYGRLMALGVTFGLLQATCDFIAIAEGNSRFSMLVLISTFALNAILDPIFIFGFGFKEAGAAYATILSSIAALSAYLVYFRKEWGKISIRWRLLRWPLLVPVARIGVPAAATSMVSGIGFLFLLREAAAHGGTSGVAAMAIAIRLTALGQLPVLGFCLGAQSVVSHAFGAQNHERVKVVIRFMLAVTLPATLAYALVLFAAAEPIAGFFTDDPIVRAQAASCLRALFPIFPLAAFQAVLLTLLQSRGKAFLCAFIGIAPQGYLFIPLLLLLGTWMGFSGVMLAPAGAYIMATLLGLAVMRRQWFALVPHGAGIGPVGSKFVTDSRGSP